MKAENWILLLTYDNLDLTKAAIDTFRAQDIEGGVEILVVDNGSSDNPRQWLHTQPDLSVIFHDTNSVSGGWNTGLRWLFNTYWKEGKPAPSRAQQVLVCNNDVLLRPDTYRWLVEDGGGFVTSVGDDSPSSINPPYKPPTAAKRPHPDFSCYLIHQWVWQKVGEFDENFKIAFGEDWDMHCRLHKAGISAECIDLPFYHQGSATIANGSPELKLRIQSQADLNREYFKQKWGMAGGSPEYYAYFAPLVS